MITEKEEDNKDKISKNRFSLICKKCGFILIDKEEAKNHKCEINEYIVDLKGECVQNLLKDKKNSEKNIKKLNNKIIELEGTLKMLQFKVDLVNKLHVEIYKTNFDNMEVNKISVELNINTEKREKNSPEKKKKEYFRSAKDNLVEERTDEEKKAILETISKELDQKGSKYFDESSEELMKIIEELFKSFEDSRKQDHLETIKGKRKKLLKYLGVDNYIKMIEDHFRRFNEICSRKKMAQTTVKTLKLFTIFELRLIFICLEPMHSVEMDEIDRFETALEYFNIKKDFEPFDRNTFIKRILNPDLSYKSLYRILKRELVDKAGFQNVAFLNSNNKQNLSDPFTYYFLDRIERGIRLWKMDWRLLDLTDMIKRNVLEYLITIFRKSYYSIFKDNVYRQDFVLHSIIFEQEVEQIIQNLYITINHKELCLLIQKVIKEGASIELTLNDKYDLSADDKELARIYENILETNYEEDIKEQIALLFDNISKEDIDHFYITKIKSF